MRKLQSTQCNKKVCLHMWNNSAGIIRRQTKTFKETTGFVMNRLSGLQWQSRTRDLTWHLSEEGEEYQAAKHHFQKPRNIFESCEDRWNNDADCRECMQENSRKYDTRRVGIKLQVAHRKPTQNDATAKASVICKPVECCSNNSWRIQLDTNASTS